MKQPQRHYNFDNHLSLDYSMSREIESAYIITLKNDRVSESMSSRCQQSCAKVSQQVKVWDAFNGRGDQIVTPDQCRGQQWLRMIKVTDHHLSQGEIATYLSHLSLWMHCISIDRPIIILEHDAIMVKKYDRFQAFNNIVYLGSAEQYKLGWDVLPIPMFSTLNKNYLFIGRAHAYAIDPQIAKNLVAHVIQNGIAETLDIVMRSDRFGIVQQGLYAYNEDGETTIDTRKPDVKLNSFSIPEMSKSTWAVKASGGGVR